jgi:hypothetical protein
MANFPVSLGRSCVRPADDATLSVTRASVCTVTDSPRAVAGTGALVDVSGRPLNRTDGLAGIFVLLEN